MEKNFFRCLLFVVLVICGTMSVAQAGNGRHYCINYGNTVWMAEVNAKFLLECGTCHIAYPPGMLPTDSWRKIMAGLETHFGLDASLTAEENEEITAFLVDNSSEYWGAEPVPLGNTDSMRITKTDWFQRKHNSYVVSPDIWENPAVKHPANCAACHRQAKCGDFGEQNRRVPR